ncbi:MAG: hypothetical protein K6G88_15330 [Lachnospiraceae bacterium]|nr:hypothetical protein [Lachnospiraceae bacterium]
MAKDKDKNRKNKNEKVEEMLNYTYRDSGQEFLMQKKMLRSIVLMIITMMALIVFIALYFGERQRVQETYQRQFDKALDSAIEHMEDYVNADGDFELRYRMIFTEITNINTFSFLLEGKEAEHKSINELYTVFLKYPEQTSGRIEEVKEIVEKIKTSEKDAYEQLDQFIASIDKKGF